MTNHNIICEQCGANWTWKTVFSWAKQESIPKVCALCLDDNLLNNNLVHVGEMYDEHMDEWEYYCGNKK